MPRLAMPRRRAAFPSSIGGNSGNATVRQLAVFATAVPKLVPLVAYFGWLCILDGLLGRSDSLN